MKNNQIKELEAQVSEKARLISDLQKRLESHESADANRQKLGESHQGRGSMLASIDGANTSLLSSSQFSVVKPMVPKLEKEDGAIKVTSVDSDASQQPKQTGPTEQQNPNSKTPKL